MVFLFFRSTTERSQHQPEAREPMQRVACKPGLQIRQHVQSRAIVAALRAMDALIFNCFMW